METFQRNANRGSISTGYDIDNSLKVQAGEGEILYRDPTSGDRRTFTISFWFKRTQLTGFGADPYFMGQGDNARFHLTLGSDTIRFMFDGNSTELEASNKLRDVGAWYHIILAVDTTQGTNTNRVKAYVNGVQYPFNNNDWPSQNAESQWGHDQRQFINVKYANSTTGDSSYLNSGYYADFCWVDGQQLSPTDLGEYDDNSGIWKPIDLSDVNFGSEGFWLKFDDSSALGADSSGNGNNFSTTNLDANNQAVDTPTNNFCTLSELWQYAATTTLTEGATKSTTSQGAWAGTKATIGLSAGKWYWEFKSSGADSIVGIQTDGEDNIYSGNAHNQLSTCAIYLNGEVWIKDSTSGRNDTDITHTFDSGHVYGIALNMDDNQISFYQNGSLITNGGDIALDGLANKVVIPFSAQYNTTVEMNFGGYTKFSISSAQSDGNGYGVFEHAPPSGYYAINTKNLAEYGG